MQAVILAAGSGSRFQREGVALPKPLLPVGGLSVLERCVRSCAKAGIDHFLIVTGFRAEQVQAALTPRLSAFSIQWVHNAAWEAGNGTSVLAAAPWIGEAHALVIMADHLLFPSTLKRLIAQPLDRSMSLLGVDRKRGFLADPDDATKVQLTGTRVTAIGKTLDPYDAIDVGAAVCSPAFWRGLEGVAREQKGVCSHTDGMRRLIAQGQLLAFDIGDDRWEDVDSPDSLRAAEKILYQTLRKPTDGWMSRHLERHLSLAVTRRLAKTPITPNQITLAVMAVGAVSAWLFAQPGQGPKVAGAVVFWFSSFLDGCDGEIARLKAMESRLGGWLDLWSDNVIHMLVFSGIGLGLTRDTGLVLWTRLGLVAAAGVLCSVAWASWTTARQKRREGPVYTSVAGSPEAARGSPWARRLIAAADALSRRDFIAAMPILALLGWLPWFLWAAAIGSHLYWIALVLVALLQPRTRA